MEASRCGEQIRQLCSSDQNANQMVPWLVLVTLACTIGFRYLQFAPFLTAGGSASLSGRLYLIRFRLT
jgi:hypothetical protein